MSTKPADQPKKVLGLLARHRWAYVLGSLALVGFQALMWWRDHLFELAVDASVVRNAAETEQAVVLIVGAVVVGAVLQFLSFSVIWRAAHGADYEVRGALLRHLHVLGSGFYQRMPTGEIVSRATDDVAQLKLMLGAGALLGVEAAAATVSALAVMLEMSPRLTLASLLPIFLLVVVTRSFANAIHPRSAANQAALGKLSARVQESFSGVGAVRALSLEESELRGLEQDSRACLDRSVELARVQGIVTPVLGTISALGTLIVVWYGGLLVFRGDLTHGAFLAFWAALARLAVPLGLVGLVAAIAQRGRVSFGRIRAILDADPELLDGPCEQPERAEGRLEVRDLSYRIGDRTVLDKVSLNVEPGRSLAIVGPVGSGKSTLARLIGRVLPAEPGCIFVDGRDVSDLPLSFVRRTVGYARQEAFLFTTTIGRNIALGLAEPDEQEAREAVVEAASSAQVLEDIEALPSGVDTIVGQRGAQLSGGQRQRVALARAFALDPPILVLDDPLSAVDGPTEKAILNSIERLAARKTVVLITSRIPAASRCDEIIVMASGRVFERGSHKELKAKKGGLYALLAQAQTLASDIDQRSTGNSRGGNDS